MNIKFLLARAGVAGVLLSGLVCSASAATNFGLVGVGRLSGDSFDQLGPKVDSLGGMGSSVFIDPATIQRSGDPAAGYTYGGTLYAVPDRGFGGGLTDFHPRLQTFQFSVTPYYGSDPTNQTQISVTNTATTLLTYDGTNFTGAEANDIQSLSWPQSPPDSVGQGRRSLDPEGLVRAPDGGWYIADEYGPSILRFDASGALLFRLSIPEAFIPKRTSYPGLNAFGTNALVSGRIRNRGFEGLTLTPDGRRLVAALQSPLFQDGNGNAQARNTRLLFFDVEEHSPTAGRLVAEYLYPLTLNGSAATNKQTLISEIHALSSETFLVLERDSLGLGDTTFTSSNYKAVVLVNTRGATNIANTGYDLERGAPNGSVLLPTVVTSGIATVQRQDLVQIITALELARFGLNLNTNKDSNTLPEKWEGLGLVPLGDSSNPDDYLLLVFNDNDFTATNVYHNGVIVGTNAFTMDNLFLAYHVQIPGVGAGAPENALPGVTLTGPTNATLSAPATLVLSASVHDQDGIITNVEFFEAGVKIGEDSTFPFQLALDGVADGRHVYTAVATDNAGASSSPSEFVVVVTMDNFPPDVSLSGPTNATLSAVATVPLTAKASDRDGRVVLVEFFDAATKLGERAAAPYAFLATNVDAGTHPFTAVATDNHGVTRTSVAYVLVVTPDNLLPSVTLLTPTNGFNADQPVNVAFTADASDPDGSISRVEYYRGDTKLGQATAAPYSVVASNFPAGASVVRAVAYDNHGASSPSPERTVLVRDTIAPRISCPADVVVGCGHDGGAPVTFSVTATDNNDTNVAIVCAPASGSRFPIGTRTVTCVATDASGNSNTCSFRVSVEPPRVDIERAVIVRWDCGEVLQGADDIQGPWTDIPGATSPYVVAESAGKRFFRVRD